ncbi:hypothetical protein K501DRAFT_326748 [Backusella circina FSU 941]|nr:hypothetical protein K501DRAFT_326748 [Backusella circina FSU 941]
MSGSALFAAKKRLENSLRKFEVPCQDTPQEVTDSKNGVLLLALLQSRLNWTTSVFEKYKQDSTFQPKRTTISRKKWPNMRVLAVCTLELGPHTFPETVFYEAVRTESWLSIAKKQGIDNEEETDETLTFRDIVFELKEAPNDRFIFPKEAILEFTSSMEMLASFVLPLKHGVADYYFESTKDKILRWGKDCQLKCIKDFVATTTHTLPKDRREDIKTFQPVNIRASNVTIEMKDAMTEVTHSAISVSRTMKEQAKYFPQKKYLQYNIPSEEETVTMEVDDLIKRAMTVPDITTGPILVEKKRNEILNAIRTGKRPRDERFEADMPKHKHLNNREDGMLRCSYCSTKHTSMWRPGPNGQGTLCNACGIQWNNGDILKDAPVISPEEEKQILKEKKERERILVKLEEEKQERERQRAQVKLEKQSSDVVLETRKQQPTASSSTSKSKNKQHQKQASLTSSATNLKSSTNTTSASLSPTTEETPTTNVNKNINVVPKIATTATTTTTTAAAAAIANINAAPTIMPNTSTNPSSSSSNSSSTNLNTPQPIYPAPATQQQQQSIPLLYSAKGIPLPTLSVDFNNQTSFSHPRCGVTLLDHHFSLRLSSEPSNQTTINFTKSELRDCLFEVLEQDAIPREILKMSIRPNKNTYEIYGTTVHVGKDHPVNIQFLEKIDPNGGAVVKRILERWIYFST